MQHEYFKSGCFKTTDFFVVFKIVVYYKIVVYNTI